MTKPPLDHELYEGPLDDLLNTAPCGFIAFRDDGVVVQVNATLMDWLARDEKNVVGHSVESILSLATRIFYQTHFFPLLKLHEKAEEIYMTLLTKDREEVPVLANAVRRLCDGGFVSYCVFLPLRERRKYEDEILRAKRKAEEALRNNEELIEAKRAVEEQARRLDRELTRLSHRNEELARISGILSHDLREPIRKMIIFADILRRENEDTLTPMGKAAVEKIEGACEKMNQLLVVLQQFISLEGGLAKTQAVDLAEVVRAAAQQVRKHRVQDDFHLTMEPLPLVEGHREQLQLLFYHLIDNAVKFRRTNHPLRIQITHQVVQHNSFRAIKGRYRYIDFARITVADNGHGFENKYGEYVFEMLKKLHRGTDGPGAGLAICKKVVENHFGSIEAEAEPGEGARFTILLPLEQ